MTEFNSTYVSIILAMGGLFFITAIWVLNWSIKKGQWNQIDKTAKSIFTKDEPEGTQTDFFPGNKKEDVETSIESISSTVKLKQQHKNRLNF